MKLQATVLVGLLLLGIVVAQQDEQEEQPPNFWEDLNTLSQQMKLKYKVFSKNLKKPIEEFSTEKLQKHHYKVCSSEEEAIKFVQYFDTAFVEGVITELEDLGFPARSNDMNDYPGDFQESLLSLYYEVLGSDELIQAFVSYLSDIVMLTDYLQTDEFITMFNLEDCRTRFSSVWQSTEEVKQVIDVFKHLTAEAAVRKSWYMISCPHDYPPSSEVVSNCVIVGPLAPPVQQVFNDRVNVSKPEHATPQDVPIKNGAILTLGFRIVHNNETVPPTKLTINSLERRAGWNLDLKNSQTLAVKIENAKTKDIAVDPFFCEFDTTNTDHILKCQLLPRPPVVSAETQDII